MAGDETISYATPVGKTLRDNRPHLICGSVTDGLDVYRFGVGHRSAYRTQHPDRRLGYGSLSAQTGSDVRSRGVVRLANVGRRVLAGGGLEAHRSVRGDETPESVTPADLPIVAGLSRGAGERQICLLYTSDAADDRYKV